MKEAQLSYLYDEFKNIFGKITGCNLSDNKNIVIKRIRRFLDNNKLSPFQLSALEPTLKKNKDFADKFFEIFIPKESYFFREKEYLNLITETLIPQIESEPVYILSAPCSLGEEVYSLKILLEEIKSPKKVIIKGIDISQSAIDSAKAGIFGKNSLKSLPSKTKNDYFVKIDDNKFKLKEKIGGNTCFERQNIMNIREKGFYDIILCRNFLIYFDKDTRIRILKKLYDALKQKGFLIVGETELSLVKPISLFKKCVKNKLIFYGKGKNGETADC